MPRLLVQFARFGPYHEARLRSAVEVMGPLGWEVLGLETAGSDATYAWDRRRKDRGGPRVVTAFPGRVHEEISARECRRVLHPLLAELAPDAMAIAGWGGVDARACLSWCRCRGVRRIVMSETRAADGKRVWWKELAKRRLLSGCDGALVGGRSHRDYLVRLGIDPGRIAFGYNVVDNDFFRLESGKWKAESGNGKAGQEGGGGIGDLGEGAVPNSPYFLASNRFIARKNLRRLVEAYGIYALGSQGAGDKGQGTAPVWPLVLLGDGEERPRLLAKCEELGLEVQECAPWESARNSETPKHRNTVFFPGFRQIDELPSFYAHAGAFVQPALEEPWGLVINEAMACGLPVLAGNNIGAAEELIVDGITGATFEADSVDGMAESLGWMASLSEAERAAMGAAGMARLELRCPLEAFGKGLAALLREGEPRPLRPDRR